MPDYFNDKRRYNSDSVEQIMKLAVNGASPLCKNKSHQWPNVDGEESSAVARCFERNHFSGFRAGNYDGGPEVINFESIVKKSTGSAYAVGFDTWSNGIVGAMMALGLAPGDEVIVTPYTMTSCATSILSCGALPVFADVCEDSGCIDPKDVERKITDRTKAIFVVHLFGIPADMDPIMEIASKHNLFVFEDCAQSPLSKYKGKTTGAIGHVGGFSFTESKHITCGEGGMAITNDVKINNGMRYVRNHGEVCSTAKKASGTNAFDYCFDVYGEAGMIGYNFRLTEMAAAFGASQWEKLSQILEQKKEMARVLIEGLKPLAEKTGLFALMIPGYDHDPSWYNFPLRYTGHHTGVPRERFVNALNAEGANFMCGYVPPLYGQEIYTTNKNWVVNHFGSHIDYENPMCPTVERLWSKELFATLDIRCPYTLDDMHNIVKIFEKVCENFEELKK